MISYTNKYYIITLNIYIYGTYENINPVLKSYFLLSGKINGNAQGS